MWAKAILKVDGSNRVGTNLKKKINNNNNNERLTGHASSWAIMNRTLDGKGLNTSIMRNI